MLDVVGALADLVLPVGCAGCGARGLRLHSGACADCVAHLEALVPYRTAPDAVPPGLPLCVAVGPYGGVLREALLGYKERGRYRLAGPLGALLAGAVAGTCGSPGEGTPVPLVVLPVPSTARAVRERRGDHLGRLAAHAVRRLRLAGWDARVVDALRARPRPDSTALDAAGRALAARASLRFGPAGAGRLRRAVTEGAGVVVVDDVVTTGSTLAAVCGLLTGAGIPVSGAAVLAATQRRIPPSGTGPDLAPDAPRWANRHESVVRTWGDSRASTR